MKIIKLWGIVFPGEKLWKDPNGYPEMFRTKKQAKESLNRIDPSGRVVRLMFHIEEIN